jgi:predicted Zn-dependent protease
VSLRRNRRLCVGSGPAASGRLTSLRACVCACVCVCALLSVAAPAAFSQGTAAQTAGRQGFDELAARAGAARDANRVDEALTLYRSALAVRPQWDEGWWYLGTLLYERDSYADAARAFQEAAKLQPKAGMIWAMLGLCEFKVGAYEEAHKHLRQGRQLGIPVGNRELARVIRYHEGQLLLLEGDFETAQQVFGGLAYEGVRTDELVAALGFAVLRVGSLPGEVEPAAAPIVRLAGEAEYLAATKKFEEAQRVYTELAAKYPTTHNVQYAYGLYLLQNRDAEAQAVEAFRREIENTPGHRLARLMIANVKLKNRDAAGGIPFAEESLKLYPQDPLGHYILGRLLFDAGQTERAIKELETAREAYKDEPKIYFQLARAYAKANRKADADRAREEFSRLNKLRESAPEGTPPANQLPDEGDAQTKTAKP